MMRFLQRVQQGAADIAAAGPGLPLADFTELAEETLFNLVAWDSRRSPDRARNAALRAQDINYLARILQAVYTLRPPDEA